MMKDQLPVLDLGLQRYKAEILQGRTFKLKRVNIVESHPSRSLGHRCDMNIVVRVYAQVLFNVF
jgi:hypothetical protein